MTGAGAPRKPAPSRAILPEAEAFVGIWIGRFANALAVLGGVILTAVMLVAVVSIIGRALSRSGWAFVGKVGPIPGDFEIVSIGAGMAIFCFLAWAQYTRGHVTVDIFVSALGERGMAVIAVIMNLVLTVAVVVLARQLGDGLVDKRGFGETSLILQIPLWYSYAGGLVGLYSFALVSGYTVWRSLNEALGAGEPKGNNA
ncbi:TRAP transporter small permease [Pararhodobacter sp.]|jgi:TRAP-type C4-dicarboxylate transport system permease small subunit|uniref:TRAP transporter small permease n=1 Tax=Pararhodobacter sp. TaxID=2127056 RepID=UPI002FDC8382